MNNIQEHPEWAFCGRCKYFAPYFPEMNFEENQRGFGKCKHPGMNNIEVASIADCSKFERKEDSHE